MATAKVLPAMVNAVSSSDFFHADEDTVVIKERWSWGETAKQTITLPVWELRDGRCRHQTTQGGREGIINEEIIIGDERIDDGDDVNVDEEEIREYREKVRRQVVDNDPSLSEIWIGNEEVNEIIPNDGDWKGFGASMGRNTHINELSFSLDTSQMGVQVVHFFRGFAMNRCIQR